MSFSIRFLPDDCHEIEYDVLEAVGEIVLGEFREKFLASLSFWTREQYESHWRQALYRIVKGESLSSLITTLYDPANANFIFWWPMYRRGEDILVQNQMLLLMEIEELLDPDNPYSFISEYESSNEDGEKISEWKISVEDISRFLEESGWDL